MAPLQLGFLAQQKQYLCFLPYKYYCIGACAIPRVTKQSCVASTNHEAPQASHHLYYFSPPAEVGGERDQENQRRRVLREGIGMGTGPGAEARRGGGGEWRTNVSHASVAEGKGEGAG